MSQLPADILDTACTIVADAESVCAIIRQLCAMEVSDEAAKLIIELRGQIAVLRGNAYRLKSLSGAANVCGLIPKPELVDEPQEQTPWLVVVPRKKDAAEFSSLRLTPSPDHKMAAANDDTFKD